jgi:microcystin-dependent protein
MTEPFTGEVRIFGGNFPPSGWAFCNGQLLPISEYEALFILIGTTYGGDGQSTFALPNLTSRIPVSQGSQFVMGQLAGQESVALSSQQLPSHTHAVQASDAPASSTSPVGNVWATWGDAPYSAGAPNVAMDPTGVAVSGAGQPHENRAPALGLSFIIALDGIFPSQGRPAKEENDG